MRLPTSTIQARLDGIDQACSGRTGVYLRDLHTGEIICRREREQFAAASLIKVAILVELERQVAAGTLDMSQELTLRDDDKVGGSSLLRHLSTGIRLPLRDWAFLMMQVSDNTATNVLIDLLGIEQINATMATAGFGDIHLHHKIDFGALWHDARHLGEGTPQAFADVLAAILEQRILTPDTCVDSLRLMDGVGAGERLLRHIPFNPYAASQREQGIPVSQTGPILHFAGKTGSLQGVRTHAGVLWSNEVPVRLAMCVMVDRSMDPGWTADSDGLLAIAAAGRLAWDAFVG